MRHQLLDLRKYGIVVPSAVPELKGHTVINHFIHNQRLYIQVDTGTERNILVSYPKSRLEATIHYCGQCRPIVAYGLGLIDEPEFDRLKTLATEEARHIIRTGA